MYVCMYLCMYVCMYVCMYACMHACLYVCTCMYVCFYVCMYACMFVLCMYVCMYVISCTHHSRTRVAGALGQASRARAEVVNSRTRLCLEHKRNTEHPTQTFLLLLIAVMFCSQSPMHTGRVEHCTDLFTAL